MAGKIGFGAGRLDERGFDLSGHNVTGGDQPGRAMAVVFEFPAFHFAWSHGERRSGLFAGLNAGLLVTGMHLDSRFGQFRSLTIEIADLLQGGVVRRLILNVGIQPIVAAVGLEVCFR